MDPTLPRQFDEAACIDHQLRRDLRRKIDRMQAEMRDEQKTMARIQQEMEQMLHKYGDLPAEENREHEQMNRMQAQLCRMGTEMIIQQE